MNIVIFSYTQKGCETAKKVQDLLSFEECVCFTTERLAGRNPGFSVLTKPSSELYGTLFDSKDLLIFVGAAGIAVRSIAPFVKDKTTDPAVLCIDELGRFVISLLSGHIGGANEAALLIAEGLNAVPVITTATDINQKFSVDAWATKNGFILSSMKAAKEVSMAVLEREVPLRSDLPVAGELPAGVVFGDEGKTGIYITRTVKEPFDTTLRLIPKDVHLGIGCRKGVSLEQVETAVMTVLQEHGIDERSVKDIGSIDIKKEEAGLLQFAEKKGWPVSFYSADELNAAEGDFTPSSFVRSVTGVDNVCERASFMKGSEIMIRKTAVNGVTVAASIEKTEVRFG